MADSYRVGLINAFIGYFGKTFIAVIEKGVIIHQKGGLEGLLDEMGKSLYHTPSNPLSPPFSEVLVVCISV